MSMAPLAQITRKPTSFPHWTPRSTPSLRAARPSTRTSGSAQRVAERSGARDPDGEPFRDLSGRREAEPNLTASYDQFLITGATGLPKLVHDSRITNVNDLPPGPFQLTSPTLTYDDYAAQPGASFLSDVATNGLRQRACHGRQSERLQS